MEEQWNKEVIDKFWTDGTIKAKKEKGRIKRLGVKLTGRKSWEAVMRLSSNGRTNQGNKLEEAGEQSQSGLCEFSFRNRSFYWGQKVDVVKELVSLIRMKMKTTERSKGDQRTQSPALNGCAQQMLKPPRISVRLRKGESLSQRGV